MASRQWPVYDGRPNAPIRKERHARMGSGLRLLRRDGAGAAGPMPPALLPLAAGAEHPDIQRGPTSQ